MAEAKKKAGLISALEWTVPRCTWTGLGMLCGSVPADPELVKAWVDARKPRVRPPSSPSLEEINAEVLASLGEDAIDETQSNILTFQRHDGACVMRTATIRAHMKDCARSISSFVGRIDKEKAFSTKVVSYVYPDERFYWTPILRPDGSPVTKHDGEMDRPITTRYGTALKRFEWIDSWRLDFTLKILTASGIPAVQREDLEKLFMYGGVHGYAGERGNGEGKYIATIEEA